MFKTINGGTLPQRQTKYSAGFDVFANEDVIIGAGETKLVGLGIAIDTNYITNYVKELHTLGEEYAIEKILNTHYLELHIRSSLRVKGLTSLGTGIIDIDYPDEIKMVIHNPLTIRDTLIGWEVNTYTNFQIKKGDKIGQLILKRHEGYLLPEEYTLSNERVGGFGSTSECTQ